jgi:hypothetical protein
MGRYQMGTYGQDMTTFRKPGAKGRTPRTSGVYVSSVAIRAARNPDINETNEPGTVWVRRSLKFAVKGPPWETANSNAR